MRHLVKFFFVAILLSACNSVYVTPNSLDRGAVFYADRGGFTMRRSVKEAMDGRGYNVVVGRANSNGTGINGEYGNIDVDTYTVPNDARYIVKVSERSEKFRPIWCALNGFWWWNFNMSIADQDTGTEIMTWRGRGCANSSLRRLNKILDEMERK